MECNEHYYRHIVTQAEQTLHYILKSILQKKKSLFLKFWFGLEQLIPREQMATEKLTYRL